jgi:predicted transcriptional regulator
MKRNQSKLYVLQALLDLEKPVQADVVAIWLDLQYNLEITQRAVSMALLRYFRSGLVHRKGGRYSLSAKGEERLQWLQSRQSS